MTETTSRRGNWPHGFSCAVVDDRSCFLQARTGQRAGPRHIGRRMNALPECDVGPPGMWAIHRQPS